MVDRSSPRVSAPSGTDLARKGVPPTGARTSITRLEGQPRRMSRCHITCQVHPHCESNCSSSCTGYTTHSSTTFWSIRHFSVPRSAMPSAQRSRLTSWMRERPSQVAGDDAKALLADVVTAAGLQAIDAGSLARLRSRPSASCRSRSPPGRSSADWRFRRRRLSGSSTALPTADRRMGGQRPRVGARPSWSVGASTPSALSTAATSAKRRGVALRVVVHVDVRFSPITTPDLLGTASRGRRLHRSRPGLASPQGPARAESYPIAWSRSPQSTTGCHPPRPCALRHGSTCPFLR